MRTIKAQNIIKTVNLLLTSLLVLMAYADLFGQQRKPEETEVWEPVPPVVTPGVGNQPPSDAIVLFDGKNLDAWESVNGGGPAPWMVMDGYVMVKPGSGAIQTKASFGSCQLHLEWKTPIDTAGKHSQERGNSGVFLQSRYEVQVLDNFRNRTYSNGQAASIYKQAIPQVNACLPPGDWQRYDIFYNAPQFDSAGKLIKPAYVTVVQNGILVENHFEIKGNTMYIGNPEYKAHGDLPLQLQDHGNFMAFRNIWVRNIQD
ncbi:MAG: DUF1080 domain-containing protein [Lewinellaceae bacterium]|nr:DUF1080 domain-containing protein [Lewinellaceae bacterium]HPQ98673.1 DUF1080 domain-containing protein [Saprospiraceae bacterium]HQU53796.1 DUF1080 domain-containing protein [Saprospiraceae bacterium]